MDNKLKRICTICARGGSKGLKHKNLKTINGNSLIKISIQQAQESGLFDTIAVSSDSELILEEGKSSGADVLIDRPIDLASDEAGKLPVIRHCVVEAEKETGFEYDIVVDLDVTSPLRTTYDIKEAVTLLERESVSNVITGTSARKSPYFNLVEVENNTVVLSKKPEKTILRRQDAPLCYDMNASIYVWKKKILFESDSIFNHDTRLYVMPEDRSVDIDTDIDLELVKLLFSRRSDNVNT